MKSRVPFREQFGRSGDANPALLADLKALEKCPELVELEHLLRQFNIFRVLRFENGEIRHSNMLAWLFQPQETHGLHDLFLRRWLLRVASDGASAAPGGFTPAEIEAWKIVRVEVFREWNHLDVLLKISTTSHGVRVVAIENKLRASQSEGQLARYRRQVGSAFPGAQTLFVFLTEGGEEPEDLAYLSTQHQQVHDVLADCLREKDAALGVEPRVLLKHYLSILEERNMGNPQITQLAKQIYRDHRRALDEIIRQRTDGPQQMTEGVGELVAAACPQFIPMVNQRNIVRFMPAEWDTAGNRAGTAWGGTDSAYVLCEISLAGPQPWLEVVDGQSPWRNEFWNLAERHGVPIERRKSGPQRKWMRVFAVQCPIPIEYDQHHEFDGKAQEVWDWCQKRMKQPDFKKIVQAVAGHLK